MISSRYNPAEVEDKWYAHWMAKNYFHSEPDDREAYTIIIPPPNVTGVLHMGHMLNNTIQDILIRKARMDGKNACWVPGTDHASIATEAKVVKMLREQGVKKSDLTREQFLEYAWEWKEKYGGIILEQLKKIGASCDWQRTSFTMDEVRSDAVIKVFVDLYNKGKLYRGHRIVHWDPEAKTVLSNEEVIYGLENSKLYQVQYKIEGSEDYVTIATTRPETIPGDTAVAVHPDDPRYSHLVGRRVIVPIIGRSIPIIMDTYVDMEFGTGALKVTPAHDINDYELGKRHDLEVIDIFNEDGTMSPAATVYIGEDRFVVRKKFSKDLDAAGHIVKIEDYQNNVGRSERTNSVVEPRLSLQWYVDMKAISSPALDAVMKDDVAFFPKNQKNIYR
ncbi:MAG: class I tRNA ligase family protein, partial [Saprospiraceae bacterium]